MAVKQVIVVVRDEDGSAKKAVWDEKGDCIIGDASVMGEASAHVTPKASPAPTKKSEKKTEKSSSSS